MKIVTIDFDIIMSPSIDLYNNFSGSPWEERYDRHPLLKLCDADNILYHKIIQYLLWIVPKMKKEDIHFIANHHSVLNYLVNCNEPIDVINVDHHHDIVYGEGLKKLTCGNWVSWINKEYKLNSYLWVHDNNSRFPKEEDVIIKYKKKNFLEYKDKEYKEYSVPDKLIICLSGEWVPPQYRHLFFVLFDICNYIHNTHYDLEDVNKSH